MAALGDALFHRLSGVVSSQTVLAHVRRATQGPKTVFNCHPFQYGRWVFAHNGDIPNFEDRREALMAEVAPCFRRFILGETDSEVVFFIYLTQLTTFGPLSGRHDIEAALSALRSTVRRVRAVCDTADGQMRSTLTLMATDGETLVAAQGGKELYLSTYKTRCADRDTCPSLALACEATTDGPVNHFIVSSEPLQGENVWLGLGAGEMVGVDASMRPRRAHVDHCALPLAV